MKAVVWNEYGPPEVLRLKELEKPIPKDDEVLIRIHASTVTAGDCEVRRFDVAGWIWLFARLAFGLFKPRIQSPGQELAGEIEAVGKNVTRFKVGDQVCGGAGMSLSAYAEYKCMKENGPIIIKPSNMSYEEAATLCVGGINGLHFLRNANVQSGDKILINGAGGSIGTYGIQIARDLGAEVTAVDSGSKLNMLTELGADFVIDYTKEDFTQIGRTWDVVIDIVGTCSFSRVMSVLNSGGRYVLGNPRTIPVLRGVWTSMTSDKKIYSKIAGDEQTNLVHLKRMVEAGKLKAVIDRRYTLAQIVEAHRYVESGHKAGNVIISLGDM